MTLQIRSVDMDILTRARAIIECEIDGLRAVQAALDGAFEQVIAHLIERLTARSKIVVTGVGKNLHIAEKISATLASTGATSVILNPSQAVHGDLGILTEGDVLLALSYSGASDEILRLLPLARRMGVSIVAVTGVLDSELARNSDFVLSVAVAAEACPFNMAPTASTTATLALGDALAMVLLDARGFRREDYARYHPGGAIGRALLLKVTDIMRTRFALVPETACVRDAMLAMTEARAGSCAVTDAAGRLAGIFTDGDLRRALAQRGDVMQLAVGDLMTPGPVSVRQDELAANVLRLFETHRIDDLMVVDAEGRPVGSVDVQDLPRLKIM